LEASSTQRVWCRLKVAGAFQKFRHQGSFNGAQGGTHVKDHDIIARLSK
jgi:hypothetical protein